MLNYIPKARGNGVKQEIFYLKIKKQQRNEKSIWEMRLKVRKFILKMNQM